MMKAPRRGLRLAEFQLLLLPLGLFLVADVFADRFFGQTDGAHTERWTPSFGQVFVTAKVESGVMIQATLG